LKPEVPLNFPVVYQVLIASDIRVMLDYNAALKLIKSKDFRDRKGDFSAVFLSADRTRNTGGDLVCLEHACGCGLPRSCQDQEMIGIMDMDTGRRYPVHTRLIFQIDKQEIYWV